MNSYSLRIANHYFCVEGDPEATLLQTIPGFSVFEDHSDKWEWIVRFGQEIPEAEMTVLHQFDFSDTDITCKFGRVDKEYRFTMIPHMEGMQPMMMRYNGGNVIEADQCNSPIMLRFALWIAFGMLAVPHGLVPIHSATVVHNNKAVLCLGESGTGKSTHTRLWLKYIPDSHLLNDDSPILALEPEGIFVYGSPWSGKTHCYYDLRFPLGAALRLSQAPYNKIRKLSVVESFVALQPSCPPALAYDDYYTDCMVNLLSGVINQAPAFHLECLPDEAAARMSCEAIFGEK